MGPGTFGGFAFGQYAHGQTAGVKIPSQSAPTVEVNLLSIGGWVPWPRRRRVHVATGGLRWGGAAVIERRRRRTIDSAGARVKWGGSATVEVRRADPVVVALLALATAWPNTRQQAELREMVLLLGDAVDLDELILILAEECLPRRDRLERPRREDACSPATP